MFVPSALVASYDSATPQGCQPFSLYSTVCVGDLIVIVVCSISGIGFFFWGIHAIRKMRQPDPFDSTSEDEENQEQTDEERARADPFYIPSGSENSLGVVQKPSMAERVRIRTALTQPENGIFWSSAPIPSGTYPAQGVMATPGAPSLPPPAAGQSRKSTSHRSGHHGSPMRGGAYYEIDEYGANNEYISASPSHARGPQPHRSGGGYRSHQFMGRMNGDATMYGY